VRRNSYRRSLRRRIIALAAAYTIALSNLVVSFVAARAAADDAAAQHDTVICHSLTPDQSAPSPDETNSKICIASCCGGCLMLVAALPLPSAAGIALPQMVSRRVATFAGIVLDHGADTHSHRSRAPPLAA
jgi:hypothetical protein